MKRFIRFVAKSDLAGMNDLTSEWMDTETTSLVDIIEIANVMRILIKSTMYFKGLEPDIEEADEVVVDDKLLSQKKKLNSLYGKKMVKISDLLDNDNYYVNCKTEEEAVKFIKCMTNAGCEWYRDTDDPADTRWYIDKEDTCYYVTKIYDPERYLLRRISKSDIYKVYTGAYGCLNKYTIFNWEDVIHG